VKRFSGAICFLFVVCMISSPLFISVEANFVPAQTSPTFSGELLPDPYFAEEPYVEIGEFSPEFSYEYTPGSVSLIWMHTAGYELDFGGYYPTTCLEYARVIQTFVSSHNESIESVKISASVRLDCTGDFAREDTQDNLWEVNLGVYHEYGGSVAVNTISNLKNGDSEDLEFMLPEMETIAYFYGPEINLTRGLSLQLTPTTIFGQTIGSMTPWMECSGSVILTITHMSFEIMLEGESQAPPLRSPVYNTTLLSNETNSHISGIESAGYDQLYQFRFEEDYGWDSYEMECSIFTLSSNHQEIRNRTVYRSDPYSYSSGIFSFAASNDRIVMLFVSINGTDYNVNVRCLDSFGNFFWNTTVKLFYQDIPLAATFDVSGNVLVYMLSLHSQTADPYDQVLVSSLVKLDNLGNTLWNKTLNTQSYWEYVSSYGAIVTPAGFGCVGNDFFMGFDDKLIKLDATGEQIWSRDHSNDAMCVDPLGGLYTFARIHGAMSELTRWDTNGNIVWTRSLGWDHGNGWIEYPTLQSMNVGPNGPLHLVLEYNSVQTCAVLSRVSRAGDLLSQDTIFEVDIQVEYYTYDYLPYITDIAVTGDGLVHLVGVHGYSGVIYPSFTTIPGTFLITYELPALSIFPTFSPVSLTMVGVASVLVIGIAYDFFFRRGKGVPEPPAEPSISDFEW